MQVSKAPCICQANYFDGHVNVATLISRGNDKKCTFMQKVMCATVVLSCKYKCAKRNLQSIVDLI